MKYTLGFFLVSLACLRVYVQNENLKTQLENDKKLLSGYSCIEESHDDIQFTCREAKRRVQGIYVDLLMRNIANEMRDAFLFLVHQSPVPIEFVFIGFISLLAFYLYHRAKQDAMMAMISILQKSNNRENKKTINLTRLLRDREKNNDYTAPRIRDDETRKRIAGKTKKMITS